MSAAIPAARQVFWMVHSRNLAETAPPLKRLGLARRQNSAKANIAANGYDFCSILDHSLTRLTVGEK
jgi:hypothetical protein